MNFHMPEVRSTRDGFGQIASIWADAEKLIFDDVEIDFSRCGWFDANMTAPLAAVLTRIKDDLNPVAITNISAPIQKILQKNGFLAEYGLPPLRDANRTVIPYRRMQLKESGLFEEYLHRNLRGKGIPKMSEGLGKAFKQKLFEIFQNSVTHSESKLGVFVCGQFYPQLQRLDITLADAGIGVRENVRRFMRRNVSSLFALRWALEGNNTTKQGPQPGGLGLKLLQEFVSLNQGKLQIASRFAFYQLDASGPQFQKLDFDFPGTVVNLEINTADTQAYRLATEELSPDDIF